MDAPLAYWNGRFLPLSEVHIALNDAGFVFGATITDFCRTFHRRLFRLGDHLARFRDNCREVHIPVSCPDHELASIAEQLVSMNGRLLPNGQELALILLATPGPIGYYFGQDGGAGGLPPTLVMHTFPLPFWRYAAWFREGARLVVPSVRQAPSSCIPARIKQRSRLHWWLAEQESRSHDPSAHALLLDPVGAITETAAANFLIVRHGTVFTSPRSNILNGISLRVTEALCGELGIGFAETPLFIEDCRTAEEALLTGTAFCLAGVKSVNGVALHWPGPVTEALTAAWASLVGLDFRAQILSVQ